ncbi:MAG TPA: hypothetical protein VGN14_15765 [Candidatus Elarobacter sp.]|jgi:hypothetical protein
MSAWPLSILEAAVVRTPSQRVAVVAAEDDLFATDGAVARYRDALETQVFPGVEVVLYASDGRLDGAPETVASLADVDLASLRWHRFDLRRPA